jgi:hypothetical protein
MAKKKIYSTYKVQYTIDIEFTNEPNKMSDQMLETSIKVRCTVPPIRISNPIWDWHERFDYLERHFPEAVHGLYHRMLWVESRGVQCYASKQATAAWRREIIKQSGQIEQQRVRRIYSGSSGRIPVKDSASYATKRDEFVSRFVNKHKLCVRKASRIAGTILPMPGRS